MALVQNQQYLLTVGRRFTHQGVYDLSICCSTCPWVVSFQITDVGSIDYVIHLRGKSALSTT